MDATLILVRPDGKSQEVPLKKPRIVVGRQEDCQIRIPEGSVSRQHCEFRVNDTQVVLKDLGSSNGTFCNRRRITQTELAPGDLISVGPCVFVLRVGAEPGAFDPADAFKRGHVPPGGAAKPTKPAGAAAVASSGGVAVARPAGKPHGKSPDQPPAKPAKPGPDDEGFDPLATDTNDSSSEFDFDFLADDKDEPKL
ncbi:MAG: FHA domain-containing protein [Phycisphaeraceae bacterium]|nr:MAG: FHA domain-containing protein [Phycisphaeraceae bacterium]